MRAPAMPFLEIGCSLTRGYMLLILAIREGPLILPTIQAFLLSNWIAGPLYLLAFLLMFPLSLGPKNG